MADLATCLTRIEHEKVEYSHSDMGEDVYVCTSCKREFIEKIDGCG